MGVPYWGSGREMQEGAYMCILTMTQSYQRIQRILSVFNQRIQRTINAKNCLGSTLV